MPELSSGWDLPGAKAPGARVTGRRLALAFLSILLLFAGALGVTLLALARIAASEDEVHQLDHAKHAGHIAAGEVREQHIQQAHSLLSFDDTHVTHYEAAAKTARTAIEQLRALPLPPAEARLAVRIDELAQKSDRAFRDVVLPAIKRGDRSRVMELGKELDEIVDEVVAINVQLDAALELRSQSTSTRASDVRSQAIQIMVACFGLAFVLAAIVGTWLTRSIVRPISALWAGARRLGSGDLTTRVDVRGKDELAQLAWAFNQMASDLAREREAVVRSQKLASIGQVAAGVAHEINNPLSVILGYVKLMRRTPGAHDDKELQTIEAEALQCQRIVQGLLDLARPQQLDITALDLRDVVGDAIDRLRESGAVDGHSISFSPEDSPCTVLADEGRMRQVVVNLLLNAVQATRDGGQVSVELTKEPTTRTITISDTGPGIPPDVLPRVFDPFFTTKREGTGLGLAIAQAIVEAHGGRIEIDTTPQGTRARLRLPRARKKRPT